MKTTNYIKILSLFFIFSTHHIAAIEEDVQTEAISQKEVTNIVSQYDNEQLEKIAKFPQKEAADIVFKYDNEQLDTIINTLAAEKNINVILPQGEIPAIKVTLHIEQKLTLSQAWDVLNTLLDVAGFCIVPQGNLIRIVKNNKEIYREPMPTYIGVELDQLPNNDQQIRYLYYLLPWSI